MDNTVQTVGSLANDTFSTFETQRLALGRLQRGCSAFTPGKACYSLMNDLGKAGSNAHALSGVSLGYAFTERISAGVSLATALGSPCPAAWTARAAAWASASMPNGKAAMPATAGICAAPSPPIPKASNAPARSWTTPRPDPATAASRAGKPRLSWVAPALNRAASLRYYGGLRRSDLRMAGYTEDNAAFPFTYADASYRLTTAYVGATYSNPCRPS